MPIVATTQPYHLLARRELSSSRPRPTIRTAYDAVDYDQQPHAPFVFSGSWVEPPSDILTGYPGDHQIGDLCFVLFTGHIRTLSLPLDGLSHVTVCIFWCCGNQCGSNLASWHGVWRLEISSGGNRSRLVWATPERIGWACGSGLQLDSYAVPLPTTGLWTDRQITHSIKISKFTHLRYPCTVIPMHVALLSVRL